jgi:alkylhydroperoxidase family enzyme
LAKAGRVGEDVDFDDLSVADRKAHERDRPPVADHDHWSLEQATAKLRRLPWRLQVLAELKATTLIHCEFCIDLASQIARRSGLSDQQLLALPQYRDSDLFTDLEKLVMDYAAGMTRTPAQVPETLFAQLREHLDEGQLVELTHHIALENQRGRFNVAFGVSAAGFSEGMVCAVPDSA